MFVCALYTYFHVHSHNLVCEHGHEYATDVCRGQEANLDVSPQFSSYKTFLYDSSLGMRGYLTGVHAWGSSPGCTFCVPYQNPEITVTQAKFYNFCIGASNWNSVHHTRVSLLPSTEVTSTEKVTTWFSQSK